MARADYMTRNDILSNVAIDARGCWIWQGKPNSSGYPQGVHVRSHVLWNGPLSDPKNEVDHKCRVKMCVNPAHLREMGRIENWRREWAFRHGGQMARRHLKMASWLHSQVGK